MQTKVLRLSDRAEFGDQVIQAMEREFGYDPENKAITDFFPLLNSHNFSNNFILIEEETETLIGHIGTKPRVWSIGGVEFPIVLMGGIFIDNKFQGHGLFRNFFQEVLSLIDPNTLFSILWSDKMDLYKKFGFIELGGQIQAQEHYKELEDYKKVSQRDLTDEQLKEIKSLFEQMHSKWLMPHRTSEDWKEWQNVESASLYIKEENKRIVSYYLKDKGQDLKDMIHEIGIDQSLFETELLKFKDNRSWIPMQLFQLDETFFQLQVSCLAKAINQNVVQKFIEVFCSSKIKVLELLEDSIIKVEIQNEVFDFHIEDLLQIILGPTVVDDFQGNFRGLYFPGIDSI
ncbi:MAG: GNAT family N-acetyltransferase [Bacteriovoracaceae bacterium]